jgi:hypothetical protein
MRSLAVPLAVTILLLLVGWQPVVPSVAAQRPDLTRVQVLAVAPFDDEVYVPDLVKWGPARLSELIGRGSFRVIPSSAVADAMKRLGLGPRDLTSPSRTIDLGKTVGADAVLTGRITYALRERGDGRDSTSMLFGGSGESRVDVAIRILEVSTRLKLLEEQFSCQVGGLLQTAMDCVMRDVALRLIP